MDVTCLFFDEVLLLFSFETSVYSKVSVYFNSPPQFYKSSNGHMIVQFHDHC